MKKTNKLVFFIAATTMVFTFVNSNWASETEENGPSAFEACLDELKELASISSDEESENNFEPEVSLEESIRIYDECLNREGITLTIHETLGEGGEASSGSGSGSSSASDDESNIESETNGQSDNLESSLQEFDTMLSQIQSEIESDRATQVAQAAAAASESTQSTQHTNTELQEMDEDVSGEESEESSSASATVSTEAKHQTTTRSPLDPKDEDIVLKTIREAAEIETSPTTKQALWDQYYDYADKKK